MKYRGVKITVTTKNSTELTGWLLSRPPNGIFLALDEKGENIQFIPQQDFQSSRFEHEAKKANFALSEKTLQSIETFREEIKANSLIALQKIDYNLIRRISNEYKLIYENSRGDHHHLNELNLMDTIIRVDSLNRELGGEIDSSGLGEIIMINGKTIQGFLCKETLPALDGYIMPYRDLDELLRFALENNLIKDQRYFREALAIETDELSSLTKEESENNHQQVFEKWKAISRITSGGLLTSGNLTLGLVTGIVTSVPTLGIGGVGVVLGIMGSAFTGLNKCLDGIKSLFTRSKR